jgi:hypothetical protein
MQENNHPNGQLGYSRRFQAEKLATLRKRAIR